MATITIRAVVDVILHAGMIGIRLRLQVATGAAEHRIIVRIRVTGRTDTVGVAMVHREVGVVERGSGPINDGREMAREAGLGKSRSDVIGIRRRGVFRGVARVTIGRRAGEFSANVA